MVGGHALRLALEHPEVERVTSIGRRKLGLANPRLGESRRGGQGECEWCSANSVSSERAGATRRVHDELPGQADLDWRDVLTEPGTVSYVEDGPTRRGSCVPTVAELRVCQEIPRTAGKWLASGADSRTPR